MSREEPTRTFSIRLPESLIVRIKREAAERREKIGKYMLRLLDRAVPGNGKAK